MPELPDLTVYVESLEARIGGSRLEKVRLRNPFLLRSVDPPLSAAEGRAVSGLRRLGKRIVVELDHQFFLVLHLMVAGRLRWAASGAKIPGRIGLAAFDFSAGTLILTEAGSKRRASLYVVAGEQALADHDPGGVEPLTATRADFRAALARENHTLKRALTDQRLISGVGNAYSDEILHRARLSPFKLTASLGDDDAERLYEATREVLQEWIERLRAETGDGFPERVTAFREDMAVHGRYRQACPACGTAVQRIVYAENEANYCPSCQTGGRLLADRSLSRLLKADWPKTAAELEERRG